MSQIEIYWNLMSQPGRAVKALSDLGSLPCKFISVDLMSRQQKGDQYLQMYPIGRIPTLKKGSFVLGESNAILIYLCETNPHLQCYYGDTPGQRATVNQYLSWYQNYFRPALFKPVRLYLGSIMRNLPILEEHKRALDTDMLEAVDELEKLLQKRKGQFIAGPHLTIADLLFFFELTNLSLFGKSYIDRPALQRWSDQMIKIDVIAAICRSWSDNFQDLFQLFQQVPLTKSKL